MAFYLSIMGKFKRKKCFTLTLIEENNWQLTFQFWITSRCLFYLSTKLICWNNYLSTRFIWAHVRMSSRFWPHTKYVSTKNKITFKRNGSTNTFLYNRIFVYIIRFYIKTACVLCKNNLNLRNIYYISTLCLLDYLLFYCVYI